MIKSQLTTAFAVEIAYRPEQGAVLVIDERLRAVTVRPNEVALLLQAHDDIAEASPAPDNAVTLVGWDFLRYAFRPRALLDKICSRVSSGGRLIYAHRLTDQYVGLTAKWLLDYFVAANYSDCRVYALWESKQGPSIATFDYRWMLEHARPVYNPMWDNITHADAAIVVAEKAADSRPGLPSQDIYRPLEEWQRYAKVIERFTASSRPWHLTGPAPDRVPPGYQDCSESRSMGVS